MDVTVLKNFKIRYFVLFSIISFIVIFFISLFFQSVEGYSEWGTFFFSLALLGYVFYQTKKLTITYSETNVKMVMTKRRWAKYLSVTGVLQLSAVAISTFILSLLYLTFEEQIRYFVLRFVMEDVGQGIETSWVVYVLYFMNVCVLAPIWEEMFFRGVLLRRFMVKWSARKSIILSSLIFGIIHLNPITIVFTFCLGYLLSYTYIKTKSIIVPMILHSFSNFLAFIQFVYGNLSSTELLPPTESVRTEMVFSGVIVVLFASILIFILVKNYKNIRGLSSNVKSADMPLE